MMMKQLLAAAIGLAGFLGCATYGVDDYEKYPGYRKEIALHFMHEILGKACGEYAITEQEIRCRQRQTLVNGKEIISDQVWSWEQIRVRRVSPSYTCVNLGLKDDAKCDIATYSPNKAEGLVKAMLEYSQLR